MDCTSRRYFNRAPVAGRNDGRWCDGIVATNSMHGYWTSIIAGNVWHCIILYWPNCVVIPLWRNAQDMQPHELCYGLTENPHYYWNGKCIGGSSSGPSDEQKQLALKCMHMRTNLGGDTLRTEFPSFSIASACSVFRLPKDEQRRLTKSDLTYLERLSHVFKQPFQDEFHHVRPHAIRYYSKIELKFFILEIVLECNPGYSTTPKSIGNIRGIQICSYSRNNISIRDF